MVSKILIVVRQLSYRCQMSKRLEFLTEENFYEKLGFLAGEEESVKRIARQILQGPSQ